jgi:hypothetical protein
LWVILILIRINHRSRLRLPWEIILCCCHNLIVLLWRPATSLSLDYLSANTSLKKRTASFKESKS